MPPRLHGLPGLSQRGKPVHTEALVAKRAIAALDEDVLDGLARTDELQRHAAFVRPAVQRLPGESGAIVTHDAPWKPAHSGQPCEHLGEAQGRQRVRDHDGQALARELVDQREAPKWPAFGQGIGNKVHAPALRCARRGRQRHARYRDALLAAPSGDGESFPAIEP